MAELPLKSESSFRLSYEPVGENGTVYLTVSPPAGEELVLKTELMSLAEREKVSAQLSTRWPAVKTETWLANLDHLARQRRDQIRESRAAQRSAPGEPEAEQAPPFVPFPLAALPEVCARWCHQTAALHGVDSSIPVTHMLAAAAGVVGNTRTVQLKSSFIQPPIFWGLVVANSGCNKSGPFESVRSFLQEPHRRALSEWARRRSEFDSAWKLYQDQHNTWVKNGGGGDPPRQPDRPTSAQQLVQDFTVEALASVLRWNPRGAILAKDEIPGIFKALIKQSKGAGLDVTFLLQAYEAQEYTVNRKGTPESGPEVFSIPRLTVSIFGNIQSSLLPQVFSRELVDNGLAPRFSLTMPPSLPPDRAEDCRDAAVEAAMARVFEQLHAMRFGSETRHGVPEPLCLSLSPAARARFDEYCRQNAWRVYQLGEEDERSAVAKLRGKAGRLALIVRLLREAADPFWLEVNTGQPVELQDVECGIALAEWYGNETLRIYHQVARPEPLRRRDELIAWIARRGGSCTVRDLLNGLRRRYPTQAAAKAALEELVAGQHGMIENNSRNGPGRKSQQFRLSLGTLTPEGLVARAQYAEFHPSETQPSRQPDAPEGVT